jgi:hypothetical protein
LTIEETISYINKISKESTPPEIRDDCNCDFYDVLELANDGNITITHYTKKYNCKSSKDRTEAWTKTTFHSSVIDVDRIQIDKRIGWINIPTKNDENRIKLTKLFTVQNHESQAEFLNAIHVLYDDNYIEQKVLNAYRYLFSKIAESGKYPFIDNDPFAPQNVEPKPSFPTQSISTDIPVQNRGGVLFVKVKIGNISHDFILDSGSDEVNISKELFQNLVSNGLITREDNLCYGLYRIADGSIISCRRVRLKSLTIGALTVHNVSTSIGDSNSPLLLGQSFLQKFKSWHIDNVTSTLYLEK